jgi:hypothetical protein
MEVEENLENITKITSENQLQEKQIYQLKMKNENIRVK